MAQFRAPQERLRVPVDQNYGRITSLALDPIEKKPLAQFMPGSKVLSVGSYGCNLRCPFCQNASIACAGPNDVRWREVTPEALADKALELAPEGNIGVAFTYNEPLVGYEFVRDTALEVHARGLKNVLVSNGYVNEGPLSQLLPLIDAANIDLKGFTEDFYRWVGGRPGHREAHHRSDGRNPHLPFGDDHPRHSGEERLARRDCRCSPVAGLAGRDDRLPHHPFLPLPPLSRLPRHPCAHRVRPGRRSPPLFAPRIRWKLLMALGLLGMSTMLCALSGGCNLLCS